MRAICHKCRNEVDEWEYNHDGYFYCFRCAEKMKEEARNKIRKEVSAHNVNHSKELENRK